MSEKKYSLEVMISEETIRERVKEVGKQISKDYEGKNPLLVIILKGSFIFAADLARAIDIDFTVDFLSVMSYGVSTKSSGVVQLVKDIETDIEGRDIIIIEDIYDTGLTVEYLEKILSLRKPASLEVATLLRKDVPRRTDIPIKYVGFDIENHFVVGCGLDFSQKHRGVPYVAKVVFEDEI